MLSGIGPKEQLEKFDIRMVSNRPGVGQNLQDHPCVNGITIAFNKSIGFDPAVDITAESLELWSTNKTGPLSVPLRGETIAFLNSKYANPEEDWPDFELQFLQNTALLIQAFPKDYIQPYLSSTSNGANILVVLPVLLRPKSVGYLELVSPDPHTPVLYQPNYLTEEDDINTLIDAFKTVFKLINTKPFKDIGAKWHDYVIPGCKMHDHLSDEYLKCYIQHYTTGLFHQSGTCKMGPEKDPLSVVDSKLRVYGVTGLRVADISISPKLISGHTMAPAIMIGEKAADMILQDWNIVHEEF